MNRPRGNNQLQRAINCKYIPKMFIKLLCKRKKEILDKILDIWKRDIKLKWSKDNNKKIFYVMEIIAKKTGKERYWMENMKIAHN